MILGADCHLCLEQEVPVLDLRTLEMFESVGRLAPPHAALHATQLDIGTLGPRILSERIFKRVLVMDHFGRIVKPARSLLYVAVSAGSVRFIVDIFALNSANWLSDLSGSAKRESAYSGIFNWLVHLAETSVLVENVSVSARSVYLVVRHVGC